MENYTNEPVFTQFCRAIQRENYPLMYNDAESDFSDFCYEFKELWNNVESRKRGFNKVFNDLAKAYDYGNEVKTVKSENLAETFKMLTTWGDEP